MKTTLANTSPWVKCPHCHQAFSAEEALGHDIKIQLEKKFEQQLHDQIKTTEAKIRQELGEKYKKHMAMIDEDRKAKANRLEELELAAMAVAQKERMLQEKEQGLELAMKKKLMERAELLKAQAEKDANEKARIEMLEREQKLKREQEQWEMMLKKKIMEETERVREEEHMKTLELRKKLEDQSKLIDTMKRKSEQGSMQLQGEVQELAIEEYLETTFPRDEVEEIGKGKRGGDCVHIVKDPYGNHCGRVLYESKRTKHFSQDWIGKVKEDQRLKQADIAVIVTEAMPDGMTRFGDMEGVWICSFAEFKALAVLLRQNLARIGEVLASQENKGDKMQLIYSYVTSNEFKQKLEASFESYRDMLDDLIKEKTVITAQWAKREKRLLKAMENLVALYGDVRGIAGGAVQEIGALEIPELLDEV